MTSSTGDDDPMSNVNVLPPETLAVLLEDGLLPGLRSLNLDPVPQTSEKRRHDRRLYVLCRVRWSSFREAKDTPHQPQEELPHVAKEITNLKGETLKKKYEKKEKRWRIQRNAKRRRLRNAKRSRT